MNPTEIIAPAIAATLFSSLVAVVYCKMKDHMTLQKSGYKTYGAPELAASEIESQRMRSLHSTERKSRGGKAV